MNKIDVPYIDQSVKYPTGCESVTTVMLLNYLGYDITVDEFIEKYLDRMDFQKKDGIIYGPNPNEYFCGSPYDEASFGCYAPVICKALEGVIRDKSRLTVPENIKFNGNPETAKNIEKKFHEAGRYIETKAVGNLEVINETGTAMDSLITEYIDKGMPVIFWACIDMREPVIGPEWRLFDSDEIFTWISNEHCMLLVGYDDRGYYFNDPYENHGIIWYEKNMVLDRHKAQYSMAVAVRKTTTDIKK